MNASKIFAFGENEDTADFCLENCRDAFRHLGWDMISENDGSRSCNTHYFAEVQKNVKVAGIEIAVVMKAGATAGYWSGANLDWSAVVCPDSIYEEYDATGPNAVTAADVVADEWLENKGLCKIQSQNIIKKVRAALAELVAECEGVFAECCEKRLQCAGIFGNGEAIYTACN